MIVWLPEKMHESCANKLLKMVEEPPANTVFLLVSEDRENVLQTIWSRCQPLQIRAIEMEEMTAALERTYAIDHHRQLIVHVSPTAVLRAIELLTSSEERAYQFDLFKEMMRASVSRNIKSIKEVAGALAGIGRDRQKNFLLYSARLFREYFVKQFASARNRLPEQ